MNKCQEQVKAVVQTTLALLNGALEFIEKADAFETERCVLLAKENIEKADDLVGYWCDEEEERLGKESEAQGYEIAL